MGNWKEEVVARILSGEVRKIESTGWSTIPPTNLHIGTCSEEQHKSCLTAGNCNLSRCRSQKDCKKYSIVEYTIVEEAGDQSGSAVS